MSIACRTGAGVVSLAVVALLGAWPLGAQESTPAKPASKPAAVLKRTYDPSRRVPDYFGEIGLTPEQKENIYKARARHQQKIDDLEKQIAQAKAQMLADCEALLTDPQKQLLEHRRRAASESKKLPDADKVGREPTKSSVP